ncbi:unnamed protein product [Diamesa hyperborea]
MLKDDQTHEVDKLTKKKLYSEITKIINDHKDEIKNLIQLQDNLLKCQNDKPENNDVLIDERMDLPHSNVKGILYFLLQVILSDLISLGICYIELSYFLNRKWTTYHELCSLYMGLETFTSTALIYFLCTINLHAISTSNLALGLRVVMKNKEENTNFIMYDDVREESSSETYDTLEYKRSLTIDYSRRLKRAMFTSAPASKSTLTRSGLFKRHDQWIAVYPSTLRWFISSCWA